jgi:hypothetical protein
MAARVKGLLEMILSPMLPSRRRGASSARSSETSAATPAPAFALKSSRAIAAVLSLVLALSVATGLILAGVPPATPALAAKSSVVPKATTAHYIDLLRFTGTSGGGMPAALAFRRQTPLTHVIPNTLSASRRTALKLRPSPCGGSARFVAAPSPKTNTSLTLARFVSGSTFNLPPSSQCHRLRHLLKAA